MIEFVCGIAVGAAFSPFWMEVWSFCTTFIKSKLNKDKQ
jgi:hypothetical protein